MVDMVGEEGMEDCAGVLTHVTVVIECMSKAATVVLSLFSTSPTVQPALDF